MKTTLNHFTRPELKMKLALRNTIISVAAVLVASCASAPPTMVHETFGPIPGVANEEQNGFLTVYSRTVLTTPPPGDSPSVLSYTDYEIAAADGTFFEQAANGRKTGRRRLPEFPAPIWCGCRMDKRSAFARGMPNC
jgi:hypothetical protein